MFSSANDEKEAKGENNTKLPKETISQKISFLQGMILKLKEIGFQQNKSTTKQKDSIKSSDSQKVGDSSRRQNNCHQEGIDGGGGFHQDHFNKMLDEAASIEGRKAYLEQRTGNDLNSGLSSP